MFSPVPNFNLILLGDKQIWSRFRYECWTIEKNKRAFDFLGGFENNCTSNNINKTCMSLNPESSIFVASNRYNLKIIFNEFIYIHIYSSNLFNIQYFTCVCQTGFIILGCNSK